MEILAVTELSLDEMLVETRNLFQQITVTWAQQLEIL